MRAARTAVAVALVTLAPTIAAAQQPPSSSQGPMTVERLHNGFLAAGDVKITEVNRRTSELVGGQAGIVFDDAFFVGGGGYWLANNSRDREMAYGGLVLQWMQRPNARIGYGARALIGGGEATLSRTVAQVIRTPRGSATQNISVRYRQDFFVAEPEANVSLRLLGRLRLTGGVGYRLISSEGRDENRLRGVTGSLGLQIS
jgi:hypothetical protein